MWRHSFCENVLQKISRGSALVLVIWRLAVVNASTTSMLTSVPDFTRRCTISPNTAYTRALFEYKDRLIFKRGIHTMMTSSNGNNFRVTGHINVRGIHRSPVNSSHKGQWRGALMFSLICAWINDWVNNRETGDLRRHRAHHDVTVMAGKTASLYCNRSIRHDKSTPNLRTRKFHQIREHKAAAACGTLEQAQCISSRLTPMQLSPTDPTRPAPSAAAASVTQTRQQTAHRLSQAGSSITHAVAAPLTMFSRFPYNTRPSGCPHCDSSSSHAVRTAVSHQFWGQTASVPMSAASAPQWWPVLASIPDTSQAAAAVTHCSRP